MTDEQTGTDPTYNDVHRGRSHMLNPGSELPAIRLTVTSGETISLPAELSADYTVLLFYRGHW